VQIKPVRVIENYVDRRTKTGLGMTAGHPRVYLPTKISPEETAALVRNREIDIARSATFHGH
jgi:hypothetical protein